MTLYYLARLKYQQIKASLLFAELTSMSAQKRTVYVVKTLKVYFGMSSLRAVYFVTWFNDNHRKHLLFSPGKIKLNIYILPPHKADMANMLA